MKVVVVEPEVEQNLGFLSRVMKNFGIQELVLVNPKCRIEESALRTSMHAKDVLKNVKIFQSLKDATKGTHIVGTTSISANSRSASTPKEFFEEVTDDNLSLVFGKESQGLKKEELSQCNSLITIPTSKIYPVMNITHAAGIILYEAYLTRLQRTSENTRQEQAILEKTFKAMVATISNNREREKIMKALKNTFSRPTLNKKDYGVLIGFFKKINGKL